MRTPPLPSLLLGLSLLAGCGGPDEPPGADPGPPPPSSAGACDPRSARPAAPELFVGPTELERRLAGFMDRARRSLDVLMYEMTWDPLIEKLIATHRRGVKVRVVLDGKRRQDYEKPRRLLSDAGVPVRAAPDRFPYAHSKILIADGVEALIMSGNMDSFSMDRARNYGVIDRDPDDLADLQAVFEADWAGAPDPDLSCTRLLVSPVNSLDRLRDLVRSARKQLDFEVMYLGEQGLIDAMKDAVRAGVPVRILLATPRFVEGNAEDARDFLAAGAQVKHLSNLHAKLVIADGVAFVGSENLSWTSLTRNREVGVLVSEPGPAAAAAMQFEADWGAGVPPMPR